MHRDGRVEVEGRERDTRAVHAEVACATGDLFFRGGAAPWFELLLTLESLRWFQSPAAGYLPLYDRLFDRGVRVTSAHVNASNSCWRETKYSRSASIVSREIPSDILL